MNLTMNYYGKFDDEFDNEFPWWINILIFKSNYWPVLMCTMFYLLCFYCFLLRFLIKICTYFLLFLHVYMYVINWCPESIKVTTTTLSIQRKEKTFFFFSLILNLPWSVPCIYITRILTLNLPWSVLMRNRKAYFNILTCAIRVIT